MRKKSSCGGYREDADLAGDHAECNVACHQQIEERCQTLPNAAPRDLIPMPSLILSNPTKPTSRKPRHRSRRGKRGFQTRHLVQTADEA